MRMLLITAALVITAATPMHAQSFDIRNIRGEGTVLSVTRTMGDWLVNSAFTQEMNGAELEHGMLGARFSFGNVLAAGERHSALAGGADYALRLPSIPVLLTIGAEYAQADLGEGLSVKEVSAPIHLSSAAALVFDSFWIHPIIVFGGTLHRTEIVDVKTGAKKYAATGIEIGRGGVSMRGHLQHNVSAPQQANLSLRFRF
jgi:hypothetical protein